MSNIPNIDDELGNSEVNAENKSIEEASLRLSKLPQLTTRHELPSKAEASSTSDPSSDLVCNPATDSTTVFYPIETNVIVHKSFETSEVNLKPETEVKKSFMDEVSELTAETSPKLTLRSFSDSTQREHSAKPPSTGAIQKLLRRKSSSYKLEKFSIKEESAKRAPKPKIKQISEDIEFKSPSLEQNYFEDTNPILPDRKQSGTKNPRKNHKSAFRFLQPYFSFHRRSNKSEACEKNGEGKTKKTNNKKSSASKSINSSDEKTKKSKPKKTRRLFGKNKDPLVASVFGKPIEKVCKIVENSNDDDSSASFPAQHTEDIDISSSTTGDLISPFSKLSTGSIQSRKVFNFPTVDSQQIPEENTENKSSSESEK